jgi:hypothetical protein
MKMETPREQEDARALWPQMESLRPDVPVEVLHVTPRIESFCWRVQQLIGEGGFALVTGAPGTGKSVTLRLLAERAPAELVVHGALFAAPIGGTAQDHGLPGLGMARELDLDAFVEPRSLLGARQFLMARNSFVPHAPSDG